MYWVEEERDESRFVVPDDVVDLAFSIRCPALPVDHLAALAAAVQRVLPWLAEEPRAGMHEIHGAETGNGWERPEQGDDLLHLSRRTKLTLRLPKARVEQARALTGQSLDVAGHTLEVGEAKTRRLSSTTTLYARRVVAAPEQSEEAFVADVVERLRAMGLRFKKILCGRDSTIESDSGTITTRSVMVADLDLDSAVRLQEEGLGPLREMGCGLFIPHKSI